MNIIEIMHVYEVIVPFILWQKSPEIERSPMTQTFYIFLITDFNKTVESLFTCKVIFLIFYIK